MIKPAVFVTLSLMSSSLLMLSLMTMTTSVYAQQRQLQQQQSQACPPGFELNRGVCQAEQPLTCPIGFISPSGEKCAVGQSSDAVATCPPGYNLQPVASPPGSGTDGSNYKCVPNSGEGEYIDWEYACQPGEEILMSSDPHPTRHFCYVVEDMVPGPCPTGATLNEESGMCELKPGKSKRLIV
jgi:hypothetical protein